MQSDKQNNNQRFKVNIRDARVFFKNAYKIISIGIYHIILTNYFRLRYSKTILFTKPLVIKNYIYNLNTFYRLIPRNKVVFENYSQFICVIN